MKIYKELEAIGFFEWYHSQYGSINYSEYKEVYDQLPLDNLIRTQLNACAFKFFREKYNLCGYPVTAPNYIKGESKYKTRFSYEIYGMNEKSSSTVFLTIKDVVNLPTHEEAELECIKKIIQINKL